MLTRSAVLDALYNPDGTGIFQKKKYVDVIDRLTTNSVFTVNFMEDDIYEYLAELSPEDFKEIIKEAVLLSLHTKFAGSIDVENAFKNLTIRLVSDNTELMHNLNAREHENTVVVLTVRLLLLREKKHTPSSVRATVLYVVKILMSKQMKTDRLKIVIVPTSNVRRQNLF